VRSDRRKLAVKIAASRHANKAAAALKSRDLAEVLNGTLKDADLNSSVQRINPSGQKLLVSYRSFRSEAPGTAIATSGANQAESGHKSFS